MEPIPNSKGNDGVIPNSLLKLICCSGSTIINVMVITRMDGKRIWDIVNQTGHIGEIVNQTGHIGDIVNQTRHIGEIVNQKGHKGIVNQTKRTGDIV
jgi:hypothetical protein